MVDCSVETDFPQIGAFGVRPGDADHVAAVDLRYLACCRADRACGGRDEDRVALPKLADFEKAEERREARYAEQADGGWSLRQFAEPEQWGKGNRAKKLRAEPEFAAPASDGHQTGLAIIVLRESGLPASDARIQSGVKWLLANQRVSGRWWTRSLNTDGPHYITYSGTAFPLLALQMCDALPKETASR